MEKTESMQNINSNIKKESLLENNKRKRSKSKDNPMKNKLRKNTQKAKIIFTQTELNLSEQSNLISEKDYKICKFILEKIKKHEKSSSFRLPAIRCFPTEEGKEYYKSIISHPQDLGHITKRLNSKKYLSIQEFYDDLTLIWNNAQKFNSKQTLIYRDSLYMSKYTDKLFKDKNLYNKIEHNKKKNNNINNNNNDEIKEESDINETDNKNNNSNNKEKNTNDKKDDKSSNITSNENAESITDDSIQVETTKKDDTENDMQNNESLVDSKEKESNNNKNDININKLTSEDANNKSNNIDNDSSNNKEIIEKSNEDGKVFYGISSAYSNSLNYNNENIKVDSNIENNIEINKSQVNNCNVNNESVNNNNKNVEDINNNNDQSTYNLKANFNSLKTNQYYLIQKEKLFNNSFFKCYEDKIIYLKHLIARQLDKLNDDDMFGLIEFIEQIRPEAIIEKPDDGIDIDMTMFIEDTYSKLFDYFMNVNIKK